VLIDGSVIAIGRVLLTTTTPESSRLDRLPACLPAYLPTYEVHWCLTNGSTYLLTVTAADRASSLTYQLQQ
jgi:hypothetical protein